MSSRHQVQSSHFVVCFGVQSDAAKSQAGSAPLQKEEVGYGSIRKDEAATAKHYFFQETEHNNWENIITRDSKDMEAS